MVRRPLPIVAFSLAVALIAVTALAALPRTAPAVAQGGCTPRPITPIGQGFFTDISIAAGIKPISVTRAISVHPRVAFADIDGDGFDDIVAHNMFPNVRTNKERFDFTIAHNQGDGTFVDVSDASGLRHLQASVIAFGDVDNDGDADAFAGLDIQDHPEPGHTNRILLNDGAGHYTVRAGSGVEIGSGVDEETGVPLYGVGAAVFADFDGDARLDLYVGNGNTGSTGYYMRDQLFLGNGDGTFRDASNRLTGRKIGLSNGAMACDFDSDGDLDVFVSTYGVSGPDGSQKRLWINDGFGSFTDQAVARGVASQAGGNTWRSDNDQGRLPEPGAVPGTYIGANGFGVDCPDIDNDGHTDILMAAISHPTEFRLDDPRLPADQIPIMNHTRRWSDPSQLLLNQGPAGGWVFQNVWQARGLPYNEGDIDAAAADFDNDGRMDIVMSRDRKYEGSNLNASIYKEIDQQGWLGLYHQSADGTFDSVGYTSGLNHPNDPLPQRMRGSGVVNWSDIDHDGDLDLFVGGGPGASSGHLFRNDIGSQNDWLAVRLVGDGVEVNRDAMGARVTITDGTVTLTREVKGSRGTYNAMDTRVLHFGLGAMTCDFDLAVRWPDGTTSTHDGATLGRNRYVTLTYGVSVPTAVPATVVPPTETPSVETAVPPTPTSVGPAPGIDIYLPAAFRRWGW